MTYVWKTEYECVCRDGSSEFYDDRTDAIVFAEQEECERVDVIRYIADERDIIWTKEQGEIA